MSLTKRSASPEGREDPSPIFPAHPDAPRRYGFVRPRWERIFRVVDGIGDTARRLIGARTPPHEPRRILLVNLAHIGDVVLTLPAITALRSRYPSAHFTLLAAPASSEVGRGHAAIHEVREFSAPWWAREGEHRHAAFGSIRALAALMRSGRYDAIVNFKSFFQENLAGALAGIPRRLGYGLYGGGFLHTHCVQFPWGEHTVTQHLRLAEALGAAVATPAFELQPRPADEALAEELLAGLAEPGIGMHVGAGTPAKQWPLDRWIVLARDLHARHGGTIVIVGGPDDAASAERVRVESGVPVRSVAGRAGVLTTAAVLRRCAAFVGGDSAPAHLAAAMGTPTLALFAGTNRVAEWRPWGPRVEVIQERPECSPCGLGRCNRADHACMTRIEVPRVLDAFDALMALRGPDASADRVPHGTG